MPGAKLRKTDLYNQAHRASAASLSYTVPLLGSSTQHFELSTTHGPLMQCAAWTRAGEAHLSGSRLLRSRARSPSLRTARGAALRQVRAQQRSHAPRMLQAAADSKASTPSTCSWAWLPQLIVIAIEHCNRVCFMTGLQKIDSNNSPLLEDAAVLPDAILTGREV